MSLFQMKILYVAHRASLHGGCRAQHMPSMLCVCNVDVLAVDGVGALLPAILLCAVPGTVKTSACAGCGCGLWAVTRLQLSRWLTQHDLEVLCAVVGLTPGLGLGA